MKIVEWNGKYGIRKRVFFFWLEYVDLNNPRYSWGIQSGLIDYCFTEDLERVRSIFQKYTTKPVVIK